MRTFDLRSDSRVCARAMNSERRLQATGTATTGSSQNQPDAAISVPPLKRKRGMSALQQDVTNSQDSDSRPAKQKAKTAKTAIQSMATTSAPRGNPTKGAKVRYTEVDSVPPEQLCGV